MFVIHASLQVTVELSQQMRYGAVESIDQSALSLLYSSRYLVTLEYITSPDKQSRQIGSNEYYIAALSWDQDQALNEAMHTVIEA